MKLILKINIIVLGLALFAACSQRDEDVVDPLSPDDYPQVIIPDDEGDGDVEDSDGVGIKLTLIDRIDPAGESLEGAIAPLSQDVMVFFELKGPEGFANLSDYITGWNAFYEIDDCTTSEDNNVDLNLTLDIATGQGSVTFPQGIEEMEIELDLDDALLDDNLFNNGEGRGFTFQLTGTNSEDVLVNSELEFEYRALDEEGIFGEWALDHTDSSAFESFKSLFGLVDSDIAGLDTSKVDEIVFEFGFEELKVLVVLTETEQVDDCGTLETENLEIELELEYEELTDDALSGDLEVVGAIEEDDGSEIEYTYSGNFNITGSSVDITIKGEFDDDETSEITLSLNK